MQSSERYGKRLLPAVIDERRQTDPDHVIYSYPRSSDLSQGFRDVTNRDFANAIDNVTWLLERSLGKGNYQAPIGYVGPADIVYTILVPAAVKAGYVMLLNSPRNSLEGHLNVIDKSHCKIWATSRLQPPIVNEVLAKRTMRTIPIPTLEEILSEPVTHVYPYEKSFEEAELDPLLMLHTSGSTGLPKPITWRNASAAIYDTHHLLPQEDGVLLHIMDWASDPRMIYSAFPFFHAVSGIVHSIAAVFYGLNIVFGPASSPTSVSLVNGMLDQRKDLQGAFLPPSIVNEMAKSPESLSKLKALRFVGSGGGPVAFEAGVEVGKVSRFDNIIGSTEALQYPTLVPDSEDWNYFHFHSQAGFDWEPAGDGLLELVSNRKPGDFKATALHVTFPEMEKVSTNDLYDPHPTKSGRFRYHGRADDVIVFSNGEKLNPTDMEDVINGHQAVRTTLVAGQGRFQACALIELVTPTNDTNELEKLTESIQPIIQRANGVAPAHGRIQPGFVLFADPEKPFVHAPKGTVIRSRTIQEYSTEIDNLYTSLKNAPSTSTRKIEFGNHESVVSQLSSYIGSLLGHPVKEGADLFVSGLDSLLVLQIAQSLDLSLAAIGREHAMSNNIIYQHPTIEQLATVVLDIANNNRTEADEEANMKALQTLVNEFTANLPQRRTGVPIPADLGFSVILTGSTGSLGAYLLDSLLQMPQVHYIYCLNRSADGRSRQKQSSSSRGLSCDWPEQRVKFFCADFSKDRFGMTAQDYKELLTHTTHIIHNQWPVNFNISLSSFEPHILGVRNLVDFSLHSSNFAHITFVSSVATAENIPTDRLPVPEEPIHDFHYASMGYGSSKLAAESILEIAGKERGVKATICRVGQIGGPVAHREGMWNKAEWLPTIVSTSNYMKKVPLTLGAYNECDWVPVDTVAPVLLEMAGIATPPNNDSPSSLTASPVSEKSDYSGQSYNAGNGTKTKAVTAVYHVQNPNRPTWSTLLPTVTANLPPSTEVVSPGQWLDALRQSARNPDELAKNPGIPLLDFYEHLLGEGTEGKMQVVYGLEESLKKSETLRKTGPVRAEWMGLWMRQWGYKGRELKG